VIHTNALQCFAFYFVFKVRGVLRLQKHTSEQFDIKKTEQQIIRRGQIVPRLDIQNTVVWQFCCGRCCCIYVLLSKIIFIINVLKLMHIVQQMSVTFVSQSKR
jgi:hypothetical protein